MSALRDVTPDETDFSDAEAALKALSAEYPGYAMADVRKIQSLCAAIVPDTEYPGGEIEVIFGIAHDIKGQGASFGYELMTQLGDILCDLLRYRSSLAPDELEFARSLAALCKSVLDERLTGDGGQRARDIFSTLGLKPAVG